MSVKTLPNASRRNLFFYLLSSCFQHETDQKCSTVCHGVVCHINRSALFAAGVMAGTAVMKLVPKHHSLVTGRVLLHNGRLMRARTLAE